MTLKCDYCNGPISEGDLRCESCGAPFVQGDSPVPDFRHCPFCSRKLLALGSPACNYCGHRLPDSYLKARDRDMKRFAQVNDASEKTEVGRKVDELIRQTIRSKPPRSSWSFGPIDISGLIDFFR